MWCASVWGPNPFISVDKHCFNASRTKHQGSDQPVDLPCCSCGKLPRFADYCHATVATVDAVAWPVSLLPLSFLCDYILLPFALAVCFGWCVYSSLVRLWLADWLNDYSDWKTDELTRSTYSLSAGFYLTRDRQDCQYSSFSELSNRR